MNTDHEPLERFIRESPWEHEQVQEHLHEQVPEALPAAEAALIVDGMAIPKRAERSVGVARQWCGVRGKVDNCQVVLNCVLARPGTQYNANQVTWPLATELYLPKQWAGGAEVEYDRPEERERYISHSLCSVGRPQSNGKIERFFQTYEKHRWRLGSLEEFLTFYNKVRPHMSLDWDNLKTPVAAFDRLRSHPEEDIEDLLESEVSTDD